MDVDELLEITPILDDVNVNPIPNNKIYNNAEEEINNLQQQILSLKQKNYELTTKNSELEEKYSKLEEKYSLLEEKYQQISTINHNLSQSLSCLSFESFTEAPSSKIKFYTGVEPEICKHVFDLVVDHVPESTHSSKLSKVQEFLMVLMKCRLNLFEQDLAYRFDISQSTVSRIFRKWLPILSSRLSFLIKWPAREDLYKTMPTCFKEFFPKCVVVIDCYEVFMEKPKDLKARAETYSSYKHHNTVKILVGCTPQGSTSFVSEPWGGHTSDVFLTENCDILKNLVPGDVVLGDRGFTMHDSISLYCAELKTPAYTRGKLQLSKKEVDTTRELNTVRIHIERIIGLLRNKYTILQSTLPIATIKNDIDNKSVLKDLVTVCSALCNLCGPVVPLD